MTIFDDVFRTMAQKMPQLLIPLINLAFDTAYPEDVPFDQMRNEHIEKSGKIITDSILRIEGVLYHIECESTAEGTAVMVHRMLEYDFAIAFEQSWVSRSSVLQLPSSCVLYLRHGETTPDYLSMTLQNAEGESMPYRVRTIKAQTIQKDEIFSKNLLLLLPFYILRYEREFTEIETDDGKLSAFFEEVEEIRARLDAAEDEGKRAVSMDICDLIVRISDYLLEKQEKMREGVNRIVGGNILPLLSETLIEQGIERGLRRGREEGRAEGREEGREEGAVIAFVALVKDGILTLPEAAARLGMTVSTLTGEAERLGCPLT